MLILPAIDIKNGKCVRLTQGKMDEETIYHDDPVEVAKRWQREGGEIIHLVDLDAAIEGRPVNIDTVRAIAGAINIPVQIGGGIRNMETADEYLSIENVKRIILGTAAYEDEDFLKAVLTKYPGRVAVGIDAKDELVAIKGWVEVTDMKATELAEKLQGMGVAAIIYTDISRDGMLTGPNLEAYKKLTSAIDIPVIASGGVAKASDITDLKTTGVEGVIIGKALYSGAITLEEALKESS